MTPPAEATVARPRLAILSYSTGEYDARSFRLARSAVAAGYEVVIYTRWHEGQRLTEERDGYRLIRVEPAPAMAFPLVRAWARRASRARMAAAPSTDDDGRRPRRGGGVAAGGGGGSDGEEVDDGNDAPGPDEPRAQERRAGGSLRRSPILAPARLAVRLGRRVVRKAKRWRGLLLMFPIRPIGWAHNLDGIAEPADLWHGMWAGSLPALVRLRRRHGGRALYDSRDVYLQSRDFARLEWPFRPILVSLERRWAQAVDQVLTVNEPYADLLATQLGVPRPPVVPNTPARWTPPAPPADLLRAATGLPPETAVVLYQGQLLDHRGIEQAIEAIVQVDGAALVLLGYGGRETKYRQLAATPPYAGRLFVLPAVPPDDLLAWTTSADVMVMPIQPTTTNHLYTTPQKLWEAIAAGVPVVASDLPGMAAVVREAGVGELCDPTDPASIAAAIRRLLDPPAEERAALRRHVLTVAHERFNWEAQLGTLFGLYERLGAGPSQAGWREGVVDAPAPPPAAIPASAAGLPPGLAQPARTIRLAPAWTPDLAVAAADPGTTLVVLDTAWIPGPSDGASGVVLLRDLVAAVMRDRDLVAEASGALDAWAASSGISGILAHEGVSTWYGWRLGQWLWLVDELLWLAVVDRLVAEHPGTTTLDLDAGVDPALAAAVRLVAERDGLAVTGAGLEPPARKGSSAAASGRPPTGAAAPRVAARPGLVSRARRAVGRWRRRVGIDLEAARRHRLVTTRLDALASEPGRRLLVVQAHARQRIETASGPRHLNVYLGPVMERLRGTALDPVEVDIRSVMADDAAWGRLTSPGGIRTLPYDVVAMAEPDVRDADVRPEADRAVAAVRALATPLVVEGVDLGPALRDRMLARVGDGHARHLVEVRRVRALLRRLHPAGILIADEYHRQDWLAAARAEGIPVAAIQHGVIYRWHTGYMHAARTADLGLPARTYVYGTWERDLLVGTSVYRPDEVVVGGSPRLDLVAPGEPDRDGVRAELGIADGDRMVVLSGTWGQQYRRFHYPIALASLFARPIPRLHVVVKLHPSERDEGPYRRIIEGAAAAGGFEAPPITVVRDVDLYRLLAAADAHLGIHSTVLTEAVATGTPNLLATGLRGADLLGYLDAGVAIGVATADDLSAALDVPRDRALDPVRREAFLRLHFEPGEATARIADDLLAWLAAQ